MDTEYKKHLPYFIFIVAVLLLCFSPAIFNVYLFHDDIFFWELPFSFKRFPMMCSLTFFVGRFIGSIILWSYYFIVKAATDLNLIRWLNSLVIAFCALGAYGLLFKYLKRRIDAALSAIMLFSLPAFEVWASHVGQSYEAYTVIFVMIALYAVDDMPLEGPFWKRIFGEAGLVSVFSLIFSNFIYPPLATFYWPMALVLILGQIESGSTGLRKKIENIYISGLTATLLFACIYKFRRYFFKVFFITAYKPDALVSNFPDKFLWFFQTVIPRTLNLWNIFPNKVLPAFIILFLAGAVILTLIKEFKKGNNKNLWLKIILGFLMVSSLVILTYLPNLLCALDFNPYRCGEGLTAVFVILLIWALRTYCHSVPKFAGLSIMTLILSIVCFWGVCRCFDNIDRFRVKPSSLEYSYLKSAMNNFHGKLKEIYVVPSKFDGLYCYYDEFGASTYGFNNYGHLADLINAVLVDIETQDGMKWMNVERFASPEELKYGISNSNGSLFKYFFKGTSTDVKPIYFTFEIKISLGEKPKVELPDSTLLIDMNNLYDPLKQIMGRYYNFKVINKGSWSGEE